MVIEIEPTVGLGCIGMCSIGPPVVTSIYSSEVLVFAGIYLVLVDCKGNQGLDRAKVRYIELFLKHIET